MFIAFLIFPPDFSKEFSVYDPISVIVVSYGNALFLAGLTLIGIKLVDEKKVLPAA